MTAIGAPTRVMVVDDSALVRGLWARLIDVEADLRVVASAWNGRAALDILRRKQVDVVLLDIEMPEMDGLSALPLILEEHPGTQVIMASTLTARGAEVTVKALSLGAADYVTKPQASGGGHDMKAVGSELIQKIRALSGRSRPSAETASPAGAVATSWKPAGRTSRMAPRAVALTSSTGGPNALTTVLSQLPAEFPLPILIVQHMPPLFTAMLADRLAKASGRPCSEAKDGDPVRPGHAYVAPGDKHMTVREELGQAVIRLVDGPPENFCRPSADPLFRSMAEVYGASLLGVVLTGMGQDGLEGARAVSAAGGRIVVQDEATSVVWGMPGAVAQAGLANAVMPLGGVAEHMDECARATR
jgi:two-component system, chemotaxis family, protein-glutamate methylesterase/glutaminase